MSDLTEEQITRMRAGLDAYGEARQRLRQAGERALHADTMRRAAIAEMGQILRDHRTRQSELGTDHKIVMDDAEDLTGVTRRTLSTAAGTVYPPGGKDPRTLALANLSDQDLADTYRSYGYDLHYGGHVLHRRYPLLAGLDLALQIVRRGARERWQEEHPDAGLFDEPLDLTQPADRDITLAYRACVDAIADGKPLPNSAQL